VSPVRYELGVYIPEDDILYSLLLLLLSLLLLLLHAPPEVMQGLVLIQTYIKTVIKIVTMNT
jgi:hypothetical protein